MAIVNGTDDFDVLDAADGVTDDADTIDGRGGDDFIEGLGGADDILGSTGNDNIYGGAGADDITGGEGVDDAYYDQSSVGVVVSLMSGTAANGDAEGDVLTGIEGLVGSVHNDTLEGNNGPNELSGLDGNDILRGFMVTINFREETITTNCTA